MSRTPTRYNSFNEHLKQRFGERVHRVAIDAGFGCPNRDGIKARGGCLYCDADGSRAHYIEPAMPIRRQLEDGMAKMARRFRARKFIAYFQAFSNTYAPVEKLRALYDQALFDPERIVGLSIGTRPDCVTPEVLDLFEELNDRTYLWVEYGLESANQATLDAQNRFDTVERWVDVVRESRRRGLRVCGHVVAGFPTDSRDDILRGADLINETGANGVKLHNLFISRRAPLGLIYEKTPFPLLTRDEYIDIVCDFLARLRPDVLVQRVMGEATRRELIAPRWCLNKQRFLNALEAELERRDVRQGCRLSRV